MKTAGLFALLAMVFHGGYPSPLQKTPKIEKEGNQVVEVNGEKEYIKNDMGMDREQYMEIFGKDPESTVSKHSRRAVMISDVTKRWPNGVVPYEINKKGFSKSDLEEIHRVMDFISNETCIKFRKPTDKDNNSVLIEDCGEEAGCWANIGMAKPGTEQLICLTEGCKWFGTILHEFTHMLGGMHEHQRPDRDKWISIHWDEVHPGDKEQFQKVKSKSVVKTSRYDYGSLMHYDRKTFPKDGKSRTISAVDPNQNARLYGIQYKTYSYYDVKLINKQYKCGEHCPKKRCRGYVNKDCKCMNWSAYRKRVCHDVLPDCKKWAADGDCDEPINTWYMTMYCRKSCGRCN